MNRNRRTLRWAALAALLAATLAGAVSAPAAENNAKDKDRKKNFKSRFQADALFDYTDNLYRLSDRELREFDNLQAPGQRFYDMPSSDDFLLRLRLRGDLAWKVAKKRKIRLMLRGSYYGRVENDIANYPRFEIALGGDITRRDTLYGSVEMIYQRFWKNLRVKATGLFVPAIYDQTDARLGYTRRINKNWSAGLEYRYRTRTYEAPLEVRDRDGDYLTASTDYSISRRATGGTALQYGRIVTGREILPVSGILIDRSYDETLLAQRFEIGFSRRVALHVALQFRRRDFTTGETQDVSRYNRVDDRWRTGLSLHWAFAKDLILIGRFRYTDNNSARVDPTADSDQLGYTETRFGVGLRYRR